jgi:hypothetical protein
MEENLADYQSKHHLTHHQAVCPWYLHKINSPLVLPRATRPSTLKGCVGNLPKGYIRNVPLPRVPEEQSTRQSQVLPDRIPHYSEDTFMIPTYKGTFRIGERIAKANSPPWQPITINTQDNLLSKPNGDPVAIVALSTGALPSVPCL